MESDTEQFRVTGTLLAYQVLCPREAWLFAHGIRPEHEHPLVQIGSAIHRRSFKRKIKEVPLPDCGVIDFMHLRRKEIHEVKKSSRKAAIDRIQAGFYLLWLNQHGISVERAILRYPLEKKTMAVQWNSKLEREVQNHIENLYNIVIQEKPPEPVRISACWKCAYQEICYA
jgi:CRISPR-associated exonuclease Cas4